MPNVRKLMYDYIIDRGLRVRHEIAGEAEAGDRYVITVNKVQRRNFKGDVEDVNIGDGVITVPLN